jgi:hypothetical protein
MMNKKMWRVIAMGVVISVSYVYASEDVFGGSFDTTFDFGALQHFDVLTPPISEPVVSQAPKPAPDFTFDFGAFEATTLTEAPVYNVEAALADVDYMSAFVDVVPMPDGAKRFFKSFVVKNVHERPGPEELEESIFYSGDVTIKEMPTRAMLLTCQEGKSLTVMLPEKKDGVVSALWKLSELFTGFTMFDALQFSELTFVLSTFSYFDEAYKVEIQPGLNLFAKTRFSDTKNAAGFTKILGAVGSALPEITWHGLIMPSVAETFLRAEIPSTAISGQRVSLSYVMNLTGIPLPEHISNELKQVYIDKPAVTMMLAYGKSFFSINGTLMFFGQQVKTKLITEVEGDQKK